MFIQPVYSINILVTYKLVIKAQNKQIKRRKKKAKVFNALFTANLSKVT